MLGNASIAPTLPVNDLQRAVKFYKNTLGLKETNYSTDRGAMFEAGDGSYLFLYSRPNTSSEHTLAGFKVDDLEAVVKSLRSKGVEFEEYDQEDLKTDDLGISTRGNMKSAWFKDTEGNILSVAQF